VEGEPQQRPPHISLGHRPTLCAGFLFPLAPNKKDAQRFLRRLIPYGGKESVKENRQGCLSRSIRAGGIRSVIKETLPGRPTKKDAKKASFFVVMPYQNRFPVFRKKNYLLLHRITIGAYAMLPFRRATAYNSLIA